MKRRFGNKFMDDFMDETYKSQQDRAAAADPATMYATVQRDNPQNPLGVQKFTRMTIEEVRTFLATAKDPSAYSDYIVEFGML